MPNQIINTGYSLPQVVISNGLVTGNEFTNPENILLPDGEFAISNTGQGVASDIVVGNFDFLSGGLAADAVVTGFEVKIIGKRGNQTTPPITVQIYAIDDTDGTSNYFPYTSPYTGLTLTNEEHVLGTQNFLFDTAWTADQVNNFKLQLVSNGDISIDTVLVNAYYYIPVVSVPPSLTPPGCIDCDSPIQVQEMSLELPFQETDTKFYLKKGSFSYADGTPVQPGDVGSCGGTIQFTFDHNKRKENGQNFEENVQLDTATGTWIVLASGVIEVDIFDIANRGRGFKTPYAHDVNLISAHDANTKVIISNSGLFYSRFVRACQVDTVFSAPINVQDEGADVVYSIHDLNFIGDAVQAEADPIDPRKANITIVPNPSNTTPTIEDSTTGTTGSTPATSLTISHEIIDANYLRVWISTDNETISGVTYDGVAMLFIGEEINAPADLKVALYGLVNPNVGVADIIVTMAGASNITAGGVSFLGVDTSNPTDSVSSGATGLGTGPTDSITTTTPGSIIQDVVGTIENATTFTQAGLWSIQGQVNASDRPGASSTRSVLLPALVVDTYTVNPSSEWAILLAGVRGSVNAVGNDELVKVSALDTTPGYLQAKINIFSNDGSVTVVKTISNPGANEIYNVDLTTVGGGGGGGTDIQIDSTPDDGTYGLLAGNVDGVNTTFIVSGLVYQSGKLLVSLNGLVQNQGVANDFVETDPTTGTFDFVTAPATDDIIVVEYQTTSSPAQTGIQFQDEGIPLGSVGTADEVDFTGAGVTASRIGNKITIDVPGGGGGGAASYFGDGSDGDVTISSNTSLTRDMFYNNLTIDTSSVLNPDGFRIYVKNTLTIESGSSISRNGNDGGDSTISTPPGGAALDTNTVGGSTAGGDGEQGPGASAPGANPARGGVGGNGGTSNSYAAGSGGAITNPFEDFRALPFATLGYDFTLGTQILGGSGGGGGAGSGLGGAPQSGAGGGGAGVIIISAATIAMAGDIEAKGGDGGDTFTSQMGEGGGGGGGVIVLIYTSLSGAGTIDVSGGIKGTGTWLNNGTNGTDGEIYSLDVS